MLIFTFWTAPKNKAKDLLATNDRPFINTMFVACQKMATRLPYKAIILLLCKDHTSGY